MNGEAGVDPAVAQLARALSQVAQNRQGLAGEASGSDPAMGALAKALATVLRRQQPKAADTARPSVLTPKSLAERWQCSERHVCNMVSRGEVTAFTVGGKLLRIELAQVERIERGEG